ncbi:MAG TPA: 23S rRNA (adenine(2503)-C(2))-methyltransferase RlmN [Clostridiaceae bacterium]|nr:23S rRNA (adenine(2503)-C(2))-methyltransferase RlmN [Clostridiaceae bacterium]
MEQKINLLDMTIEEISKHLEDYGVEKYRAKQVFQWIHKGIGSFDEMTNIPMDLRQKLKDKFYIGRLEIQDKLVSRIDGTVKYLFKLIDGNIIESVLMKYKHGYSACISSQVGCKMGCKFCASTGAGFIRNLSSGEIVGQILAMQKDQGIRIGNIVIMGIGEPLDNYDNVIKFLKIVNNKDGLNVGYRHISVSTCGLVPGILRLSEENLPVTLSISLHAPDDETREQLMPVNKRYSIDKLIEACKIYTEVTKRRITFEYAVIAGVNDSKNDARKLAHRIKGLLCHVNLIPVNTVEGTDFRQSDRQSIERFKKVLEEHGIETTIRRELGSDINAACGQLRRKVIENQ